MILSIHKRLSMLKNLSMLKTNFESADGLGTSQFFILRPDFFSTFAKKNLAFIKSKSRSQQNSIVI